jgi:hypothetical protein
MNTLKTLAATVLVAQTLQGQDFWQPINEPGNPLYRVSLACNANGDIFAPYEKMYRSTNNGSSWAEADSGLPADWYSTAITVNSAGTVFLGGNDRSQSRVRVFHSTDNGDTWVAGDSGMGRPWVVQIACAPNGTLFLASCDPFWPEWVADTTSYGVFRSTDNGNSWKYAGLNQAYSVAASNNGSVFARDQHGWFRSTDNGETWDQMALYTGGRFVVCNDSNHVFALGESGGSRSTDDGLTWSPFCTFPVTSIAFTREGHIFAGITNAGVYLSTNNGVSWSARNSGFTDLRVGPLMVTTDGYLFAITGGGLFRSMNPTTGITSGTAGLPATIALDQNYPNPFNPSTIIKFQIPVSGRVTLRVFDIIGKEVATLVDEILEAGTHTRTFDAGGVASGVYFYHLQAGSYAQTKRLVLLR